MARGSPWIVSRITTLKPDVAQNSNALNNEHSFASVKKNTLEDIQCSFQINHFHCKYFCKTFLFDLPYIKKLLSKTAYMLLFIESKWCEEQFCVILRFVLSTHFLILKMLLILNENFNL